MSKDDFSMSLAAGEAIARMREHMEKQFFDPNLNGYGTSFGNNWAGQSQQGLGLTDAAQAMQQAYGAGGGGGGQLGQGGFNIKPGGGVRVQTGQSRPAPKPESVITTDSTGDIHRVMIDGAAVMETSDPAEAREIAGKLEALGIGMADPLMSKMGFAPVVMGIDPASGPDTTAVFAFPNHPVIPTAAYVDRALSGYFDPRSMAVTFEPPTPSEKASTKGILGDWFAPFKKGLGLNPFGNGSGS